MTAEDGDFKTFVPFDKSNPASRNLSSECNLGFRQNLPVEVNGIRRTVFINLITRGAGLHMLTSKRSV